MAVKDIGIIVNGATGRIASTQHLANALLPIRTEGGLAIGDDRIVPRLLLCSRDEKRLAALAQGNGIDRWTTDLDAALSDPGYSVFFDAAATGQRVPTLTKAIAAGKYIYSEKPVALSVSEGMSLLTAARARNLKHGAVEDKIFLPGLQKLVNLAGQKFFGRVTGFRLDFGWWVFDGELIPAQRPSWNYRQATGGGLILDMFAHWRYIFDRLLGPIKSVSCRHATLQKRRIDETGRPYDVDVEDHAFALFELEGGIPAQISSSWANRVKRDDLLQIQVDGTAGSAVAGLHRCFIQPAVATPRPFFSPEVPQAMNFDAQWQELPDLEPFENGYRAGWELFLRHVAEDGPFPAPLIEGAKSVQLAEACYRSHRERRWVDLPALAL